MFNYSDKAFSARPLILIICGFHFENHSHILDSKKCFKHICSKHVRVYSSWKILLSLNNPFKFSETALPWLICLIVIYLYNLVFNVVNKQLNVNIIECIYLTYIKKNLLIYSIILMNSKITSSAQLRRAQNSLGRAQQKIVFIWSFFGLHFSFGGSWFWSWCWPWIYDLVIVRSWLGHGLGLSLYLVLVWSLSLPCFWSWLLSWTCFGLGLILILVFVFDLVFVWS